MNPGGLVLIVAGVWVGCQIFGGHALERLGIITPTSSSTSTTAAPAVATAPAPSTAREIFA